MYHRQIHLTALITRHLHLYMEWNRSAAEVLDNQATASWDLASGQNYAEWTKDNVIYKVWLEDSSSMEERLKLVTGNSLAGAAFLEARI